MLSPNAFLKYHQSLKSFIKPCPSRITIPIPSSNQIFSFLGKVELLFSLKIWESYDFGHKEDVYTACIPATRVSWVPKHALNMWLCGNIKFHHSSHYHVTVLPMLLTIRSLGIALLDQHLRTIFPSIISKTFLGLRNQMESNMLLRHGNKSVCDGYTSYAPHFIPSCGMRSVVSASWLGQQPRAGQRNTSSKLAKSVW